MNEEKTLTRDRMRSEVSALSLETVVDMWLDQRDKIARLKRWIADLQNGGWVNCVYCGKRYGPSDSTPVALSEVLKRHVEECPEHPMSKLKSEIATLSKLVEQACDRWESCLVVEEARQGYPSEERELLCAIRKELEEQINARSAAGTRDITLDITSPISEWFELSYAQFLTVPRLVMESMAFEWQEKMAALLNEMDHTFNWRPQEGRYWVRLRDEYGRFQDAPLSDYRHGSIEHLRIVRQEEEVE